MSEEREDVSRYVVAGVVDALVVYPAHEHVRLAADTDDVVRIGRSGVGASGGSEWRSVGVHQADGSARFSDACDQAMSPGGKVDEHAELGPDAPLSNVPVDDDL